MYLLEVFFWLIGGVLVLFYLGYYGLMFISSKKPVNVLKQRTFPKISLVVPTYNEEKVIKRKLLNILELDYPRDALEVLIVDSGSDDNTLKLVKLFSEEQNLISFRLLVQPRREGKASALNYCRPYCNGDIIVLTDADILLEKDALTELVMAFADPTVGAVSGKIVIKNADQSTSTKSEKSYRDMLDMVRTGESNLDSTPIFNGQLSAFRKELMSDIKPSTIADDTELSFRVREKGWKAIYESKASAYEYTPTSFMSKNKQKIRRGHGIIQSILWHRRMIFNSQYGKYGLVILPSELFMHVVSPLLVSGIIVLTVLNLLLTAGFLMRFGLLVVICLILFGSVAVFPWFIGRRKFFNPFETGIIFLNSQFSLILSILSLIFYRKRQTWGKIEEVRALD